MISLFSKHKAETILWFVRSTFSQF